jgi:hypothetical protein
MVGAKEITMPNESTGTKLLYALGGTAVGALGAYLLLHKGDEDQEDRPPILVRDGSLVFESGDPQSHDPTEKTGKAWIDDGEDWQPEHPEGKGTKWFVVEITSTDSSRPSLLMAKKIEIIYEDNSRFVIEAKRRIKGGGRAPTISGPLLQKSGTQANPQLIYDAMGHGKISKIMFTPRTGPKLEYPSVTPMRIWQF